MNEKMNELTLATPAFEAGDSIQNAFVFLNSVLLTTRPGL